MHIKYFFKHIGLVIRHKNAVLIHCAKCGILWRGIVHDLSKFTPAELFESAKYYQGNRSPITACRETKGRSDAWLHHKAHNKHHAEYWIDFECKEHPMMPYKYAVECVCDKLAATKTYNGKNYTPDKALNHFVKYGGAEITNPKTRAFIIKVFTDLSVHGEDYILNKKYMKENYRKICETHETNT